MLGIVPSCNPVQQQGKLMMQTCENGENPNFGHQIFFSRILPPLIRHSSKLLYYVISRKTNESNLRKWWQTYFAPNFGPLSQKLGP